MDSKLVSQSVSQLYSERCRASVPHCNGDPGLQPQPTEAHVRHLTDIKPDNISIELGVGMMGEETRPKEFLH
jgi:hypothetical protein